MSTTHLPDLDAAFNEFLTRYIADFIGEEATDEAYEAVEEQIPQLYMEWLDLPCKALDGVTPRGYFQNLPAGQARVDLLCDYLQAGEDPPEPLLDIIADDPECEKPLLALLVAPDGRVPEHEAKMWAVNLLAELQSTLPMELYVEWVAAAGAEDELCELAAEKLADMGPQVCEAIHAVWEKATPAGQQMLLDTLRRYPGNDRTLALLIAAFEKQWQDRALYASYLGGYGDDRALPFLQAALDDPELNYLTYIEIVAAIEALGDTPNRTREFDGDPDYEVLRNMDPN